MLKSRSKGREIIQNTNITSTETARGDMECGLKFVGGATRQGSTDCQIGNEPQWVLNEAIY
jgi:hypothetical protein